MPRLSDMQCQPCAAGTPPLKGLAIARLLEQLDDWQVVNEHHLTKEFRFADFASALAFVNRVGQLAEQQGHHPDIHLGWGRARIETWTHSIGGLSEADFILAAHIDALPHNGP
jgi:4a-hydroxytetrahydrobiopterin dehydratase